MSVPLPNSCPKNPSPSPVTPSKLAVTANFSRLGGVNLIYCFASPARVLKMPPHRPILSAKSPRQSILLPIFTNFCQTGKKTNILNIYLAVTTLSSPTTLLVINIYVYSVEVGVWNRYRPSRIRSACLAVHRSRWNGQNVSRFTRMTCQRNEGKSNIL